MVFVSVLAIGNIPRSIFAGRHREAFASSSAMIATLVGLLGVALYPNLVTTSLESGTDLTIYSAASSTRTLQIMALIAAIGMPFVLAYTVIIYWTFRGPVSVDEEGY